MGKLLGDANEFTHSLVPKFVGVPRLPWANSMILSPQSIVTLKEASVSLRDSWLLLETHWNEYQYELLDVILWKIAH